jgi:hypothetical protein
MIAAVVIDQPSAGSLIGRIQFLVVSEGAYKRQDGFGIFAGGT